MTMLAPKPLKRAYARLLTKLTYTIEDIAIVRPVPKALVIHKRDVWIKQHVDDVVLHFALKLDPWGDDHEVTKVWAEIYSDEESEYVTRALTPDEQAEALKLLKSPIHWEKTIKHINFCG